MAGLVGPACGPCCAAPGLRGRLSQWHRPHPALTGPLPNLSPLVASCPQDLFQEGSVGLGAPEDPGPEGGQGWEAGVHSPRNR